MAYVAWSVVAFETPTAAKWNILGANDASFHDGTGIDDDTIDDRQLDFANISFGNYSTSEVNTGFKWINGKDIFTKTISFGTLPNTTSKDVAHGVTGMEYCIKFESQVTQSGPFWFPANFSHPSNLTNQITIWVNPTNITITTGSNRSTQTAYVTLYYTKV